tara:strand:- start:1457 stop:1633 length:177 start_codon:yes stop_codon:yes gene_type:complete
MKDNIELKTRYEYQGHNGEKHIVVPIMYDPNTGKEYDIADIEDTNNVYSISKNKKTNK